MIHSSLDETGPLSLTQTPSRRGGLFLPRLSRAAERHPALGCRRQGAEAGVRGATACFVLVVSKCWWRAFDTVGICLLNSSNQLTHARPHSHRHGGRRLDQRRQSFIVKFDSPDEAQRAIREKQAELWGTGKIHIVSYK